MKIRSIKINIKEYKSKSELPKVDQDLIEKATMAVKASYAPYSEFHVGAAVLLDNGKTITGSNQENSAYPSGLCAERVALFHAKHLYPEVGIRALAVTAFADNFEIDQPVTPCGACRQVIAETQNRQTGKIKIILNGEKGVVQVIDGIENLLPLMFKEEKLKRKNLK